MKPHKLWPNAYLTGESPGEDLERSPGTDAGREQLFRRNFAYTALLHLLVIGGLFAWSSRSAKPKPEQVVWLDEGALAGGTPHADQTAELAAPPEVPAPEALPLPPPPPDSVILPPEPREDPKPAPAAAPPSELPTVRATPAPAIPHPAAAAKAKPRPTPKPKAIPKPTPKSAPKAKPDSTPKSKATPKPAAESHVQARAAAPHAKSTREKGNTAAPGEIASANSGTGGAKGNGPGKGAGKTGAGAGASGASEFGWYLGMIRDRFYSVWQQPTSIVRSSANFVTRLHLRIGKDGAILSREVVIPSGNAVMDDSVLTAAQKVTQIDALPAGLGDGESYEVSIDFKLDQGE